MRSFKTHALALGAGLIAGALLLLVLRGRPDLATIEIVNVAEAPIASIKVDLPDETGVLLVENLAPGEGRVLPYYIRGEGDLRVSATFSDGTVITTEHYVEKGYSTLDHIHHDRIEVIDH
ncbi:MAG: hypothetical protein ACI80V_002496 [Rhodothermales bacterium]|jgi:hypothetical protein